MRADATGRVQVQYRTFNQNFSNKDQKKDWTPALHAHNSSINPNYTDKKEAEEKEKISLKGKTDEVTEHSLDESPKMRSAATSFKEGITEHQSPQITKEKDDIKTET